MFFVCLSTKCSALITYWPQAPKTMAVLKFIRLLLIVSCTSSPYQATVSSHLHIVLPDPSCLSYLPHNFRTPTKKKHLCCCHHCVSPTLVILLQCFYTYMQSTFLFVLLASYHFRCCYLICSSSESAFPAIDKIEFQILQSFEFLLAVQMSFFVSALAAFSEHTDQFGTQVVAEHIPAWIAYNLPGGIIFVALLHDLASSISQPKFVRAVFRWLSSPFRSFLTLEDLLEPVDLTPRYPKPKNRFLVGLASILFASWMGCLVFRVYMDDHVYAVKSMVQSVSWVSLLQERNYLVVDLPGRVFSAISL